MYLWGLIPRTYTTTCSSGNNLMQSSDFRLKAQSCAVLNFEFLDRERVLVNLDNIRAKSALNVLAFNLSEPYRLEHFMKHLPGKIQCWKFVWYSNRTSYMQFIIQKFLNYSFNLTIHAVYILISIQQICIHKKILNKEVNHLISSRKQTTRQKLLYTRNRLKALNLTTE